MRVVRYAKPGTQIHRHTGMQADTETGRYAGKAVSQACRQIDTYTGRQASRQAGRQFGQAGR